MKREETFDYLSDQELEQLIAMVEQEELIPAPPDLVEEVFAKLWQSESSEDWYESNRENSVSDMRQNQFEELSVQEVELRESNVQTKVPVRSTVREKADLKGEGARGKSSEKIIILQKRTREERSREFRLYCIRVITSAAAALVLLFTLPALLEEVTLELRSRQAIEFVQRHSAKELQSNPTREEVLGEKGLWDSAFGNKKIFGADSTVFETIRQPAFTRE